MGGIKGPATGAIYFSEYRHRYYKTRGSALKFRLLRPSAIICVSGMDRDLVDLSLFTMPPTEVEVYRASDYAALSGHHLHSTTTWPPSSTGRSLSPTQQAVRMKPLPKVPKWGLCDLMVTDARNNNKCILKRIKRVRLDSVLNDRSLAGTPSAYATARSAYVNPHEPSPPPSPPHQTLQHSIQQSLQARRNHTAVPQLTLPDTTQTSETQSGLPMIWLSDEQMWLVADPSDPGYGYYATGPEDGMDEWLPPYTEAESSPSNPSYSDLSPVREQFMSLMEQQRRRNSPRGSDSNCEEPRLSPLFQEAMQGVSMLDFSDYQTSSSDYGTSEQEQQQDQLRSGRRQYIPYRPLPESYNQTQQKKSNSSRSSSQQRTHQPNLYIPDWKPPAPSFAIPSPRAQSDALRTVARKPVNWSKYGSEAEIKRQQERMERRKGHMEKEQEKRERRDSCCSDSGVSIFSTAAGGLDVGPEPGYWGVQRASSARH